MQPVFASNSLEKGGGNRQCRICFIEVYGSTIQRRTRVVVVGVVNS